MKNNQIIAFFDSFKGSVLVLWCLGTETKLYFLVCYRKLIQSFPDSYEGQEEISKTHSYRSTCHGLVVLDHDYDSLFVMVRMACLASLVKIRQ